MIAPLIDSRKRRHATALSTAPVDRRLPGITAARGHSISCERHPHGRWISSRPRCADEANLLLRGDQRSRIRFRQRQFACIPPGRRRKLQSSTPLYRTGRARYGQDGNPSRWNLESIPVSLSPLPGSGPAAPNVADSRGGTAMHEVVEPPYADGTTRRDFIKRASSVRRRRCRRLGLARRARGSGEGRRNRLAPAKPQS